MTDLGNPTPTESQEATPGQADPSGQVGTVPTGSDAATRQSAPTDDGFTRVDPNTLPPQLRSAYDNMLRDYKEKTTKLSETIKSEVGKSTESFRQRAELYDQIAKQEEFVKQWNDYVERSNGQQQVDANGNPAINELQEKLSAMEMKFQRTEMLEVTDAFAEAVDEKGQKLNPEFDRLNTILMGEATKQDGTKDEYSLLRASIELAQGDSPQEKLANGYANAKKIYDSIFEAGRKSGMGRMQAKILNSTQPPSGTSTSGLSVTDKKPKNAREAFDLARRGVMVSRD